MEADCLADPRVGGGRVIGRKIQGPSSSVVAVGRGPPCGAQGGWGAAEKASKLSGEWRHTSQMHQRGGNETSESEISRGIASCEGQGSSTSSGKRDI